MKYISYTKLLLAVVFMNVYATASAQNTRLQTNLQRAAATAQAQQESSVLVTAVLRKPVKMSDVMCRPTRGCNNQVVSYKQKTNTCRGTLSQSGKRVYMTADCVTESGYNLSSVSLQFANGKVAKGTGQSVVVEEDTAYALVKEDVTRGLHGLVFATIPQGQSLQETFGKKMTYFLADFFRQKGVSSRRLCRMGSSLGRGNITLRVGEPVIYQGKVVALVKDVPSRLPRLSGKVSENALAVIRS